MIKNPIELNQNTCMIRFDILDQHASKNEQYV